METIREALQSILGTTEDWYVILNPGGSSRTWDYGAMFEYFFAGLILCIVVCSVFRFLVNLVK